MKSTIAKMNPTTRLLLGAVIAALFSAALYFQGYMPQADALGAEKNKNKTLKPDVALKQLKLNKIKTQVTEPVPITPGRRKELVDNGSALFDAASRQEFLASLPKIAKVSSLQDFTLKDASGEAPERVIISLPGDSSHELNQITKIPVAMRFKGPFSALNNFLARLRDRDSYMKLGSIKMRSIRNTDNIYVDLMVYLYSEEGS